MPSMMEEIKELRGKRHEVAEKQHAVLKAGGDDPSALTLTAEQVTEIRAFNDELDEIGKKLDPLEADLAEVTRAKKRADDLREIKQHPGHPDPGAKQKREQPSEKSFGELFTDSDAYKRKGAESNIDIQLKTLLDSATGWVPDQVRGPRLVDFATRPIQVTDAIPQTQTNSNNVVYMEETTFTNAAAETAEGATKPEAALALTEKNSPVRKIAVWIPVTDEQLEDVAQVQAYLNNRLPFMVRQRLDSQILVGNGTAPNLRGALNIVGIQTQAKGADPTPDAIYKAMVKVRVIGRAMPSAVILHPNDWQDVRLLRTADGIYIWGSPSEMGTPRIWGLPVIETDGITENTGLVGDFQNFTELAIRKGIEVKTSDQHADFFITNKQAVRAEMRAAFIVYRPTALATITGI